MHGTFNGIQLRKISSIIMTESSGFRRSTFRVLDGKLPGLERVLQLNTPGLLILSAQEIQGTIIHYTADVHSGYEITLDT